MFTGRRGHGQDLSRVLLPMTFEERLACLVTYALYKNGHLTGRDGLEAAAGRLRESVQRAARIARALMNKHAGRRPVARPPPSRLGRPRRP